jgi:hypothetical protein
MIRVADGELVHVTVPSYFDHYQHPGVRTVPIRDLPPSETALVWLKSETSLKGRGLPPGGARSTEPAVWQRFHVVRSAAPRKGVATTP